MVLYKQIAEELARRIREGHYKPGERIPSIRRVAGEFECNKLTVQKAFEVLKRNRVIENVVGSGSFVRFPEKIASSGRFSTSEHPTSPSPSFLSRQRSAFSRISSTRNGAGPSRRRPSKATGT